MLKMTDVHKIIQQSIERLLKLGVNFRLHRYLFNRHAAEWRNLSTKLHNDYTIVDSSQFLEDALAILSQIYFLCLPRETHLRIYPWDPLIEKGKMEMSSIQKNQIKGSGGVWAGRPEFRSGNISSWE